MCPLRHAELQLRVEAASQQQQEVPENTSDTPSVEPTSDLFSPDVQENLPEEDLELID